MRDQNPKKAASLDAEAPQTEAADTGSFPASGFGSELRTLAVMALSSVLTVGCATQKPPIDSRTTPTANSLFLNELSRKQDQATLASQISGRPLRDYSGADRKVDDNQYMVISAADGGTQALAAYSLYLETAVVLYDKDAKVAAATIMSRMNVDQTMARITTDMGKLGAKVENMEAWVVGGLLANDAENHEEIKTWLSRNDVELKSYNPRVDHYQDPIFNVAFSLSDGRLYEVMPTQAQLNEPHKYRDGAPLVKLPSFHEGDLASGRLRPNSELKVAPLDGVTYKGLPAAAYQNLIPSVFVNEYSIGGGRDEPVQAMATYSITDCIAVGMWDSVTQKGALIHFRSNAAGRENLDRVASDLKTSGADIRALQIGVIGGSDAIQRGEPLSTKLYNTIQNWARDNHYSVVQDTGLSKSPYYHVQFSLSNGRFYSIEPKSFEAHEFTPRVPQKILP